MGESSKQYTDQQKRIQQLRLRPNSLDGVEEFQFTNEKFQQWCEQYAYNPKKQSKPKYLIKCDICKKILTQSSFNTDQFRHINQNKTRQRLIKLNGKYPCPIFNCSQQQMSSRQLLINHLMTHNEETLQEHNIDPNLIFKGLQLQSYTMEQKKINQLNKDSYYINYKKDLINQGILEENPEQLLHQQCNSVIDENQIEDQSFQQQDEDQIIRIRNRPLHPEIIQLLASAKESDTLIEDSSKEDLKYTIENYYYEKFQFDNLINDKTQYQNLWQNFKYLNYFRQRQTTHLNQLCAVKVFEDDLTIITRPYNVTLKKILEGNHNDKEIKLIILGMIKGIQNMHEENIVHRDIKPENILIQLNPDYQIFITSFDYCIDTRDKSNSKPNFKNQYMNSKIKIIPQSTFWDIYAACQIIIRWKLGDKLFSKFTKLKQLQAQFLKKHLSEAKVNKDLQLLLREVVIDHNQKITVQNIGNAISLE